MSKNKDNSLTGWWKEEWLTLVVTIACPIIATAFTVLSFFQNIKSDSLNFSSKWYVTWIYFLQMVFVGISFYYLWGQKKNILHRLKKQKNGMADYFRMECHVGDEEGLLIEDRIRTVKDTVSKFYKGWVFIWVLWICYYGIMFLVELIGTDGSDSYLKIQHNFYLKSGVEVLCGIAMFYIYVTLNNVTVAKENREEENSFDYRLSMFFLLACFVLIASLFYRSTCYSDLRMAFFPMLLASIGISAFSTLAFVLMLGKLNSYYLQIPIILNLAVYVFAIIQIFSPLTLLVEGWECTGSFVITTITHQPSCGCACCQISKIFVSSPVATEDVSRWLNNICVVYHCITLIGKMCLALVLYWTAYKFRFLYFVVTKSVALTETPEKLRIFWKYIGKKEE